ncbi:MAG: hypothetical protein J1E06_01525 [Acutalibacter sp.]|nr:hypothetical protein [Acutalibacter sp.]
MSIPTILPSGQLHPDLVNNAAFVKHIGGGAAQSGQAGQKVHQAGADALKENSERLSRDFREGRMDVVDLTSRFAQSSGGAEDGKTVIQNRPSGGLIVETIDPNVITAEDANRSAAAGGATHGFFYRGTDFLLEAAKEYAALGENEEFAYRNIADVNFVRDALDFFTNGNYSQSDVNAVQEQMTEVVRELARQIKNGEAPDLSKLQSKLTIGGADVTISQLTDMQKMGRELSGAFNGITSGSLTANNIEAFAKMGIAKSLGNYYGGGKGEIGKLFSSAVDRLYENGVAQVEKAEAWARTASYAAGTSGSKDAVETELGIAELFSKLDTGSKTSLEESFSSVLSQVRALVRGYCDRCDLRTSDVGLAGATDNLSKFFRDWAERL